MLKALVYAYATGVFSLRKIERRPHGVLAFRMLAGGNFPRHRTTCDIRALHLQELSGLFVQFREGKEHAEVDAAQYPYTAAMAAKGKTDEGGRATASASGSPNRPTA